MLKTGRLLFVTISRSLYVVFALSCTITPLHAEVINIAVAANFTDATRSLVSHFEQHTGHEIRVSFGSTGKLYSQIEHGAPYVLFLAADSQRPRKAEVNGLAVNGSRFTYAKGRLALWSPKPELFTEGESYLKQAEFRLIAIANPKTAPYGHAAQEVMEKLGLLETLKSKLVRGDSIAQTFQFVASGNVESGFVALSQAKTWKETGTLWEIPQDYYEPINQQVVLLKKGEGSSAARAFLEFLKSKEAITIISRYGYGVDSSYLGIQQ